MNILEGYITFLKEYNKLRERGISNIYSSNDLVWIDDIEQLNSSDACESSLLNIFTPDFSYDKKVFVIKKPHKPIINISNDFKDFISFNEADNKFTAIEGEEQQLENFKNSEEGKKEIFKINEFKKSKNLYTKLFRACNDIKADSNIEIVLSIGLVQYSSKNRSGNLSKINQHIFHFPLSISCDKNNAIDISFLDPNKPDSSPYSDGLFLKNTPYEKKAIINIFDRFDERVFERDYRFIADEEFKLLIEQDLQNISSNSIFSDSLYKPEKDHYLEDYFKISFSPAIAIKQRKPRFFEKLIDSIIEYDKKNNEKNELFKLLLRNQEINNSYPKDNYFKQILYEDNKLNIEYLNREEDFSVFFPLPYNKEQKDIYENYLKNRLTVVTGPPGTGKSHTIVNILCSLLAQGKRILVTAQTDKALESLLDKIPQTFDSLVFTKIELETNKNRFSLEKSINNLSKILKENFRQNVKSKISDLDLLKKNYVRLKKQIIDVLEKEYNEIYINDSFDNLRPYQIVEKFENKREEEWNWIIDDIKDDYLNIIPKIKEAVLKFQELNGIKIIYTNKVNSSFSNIIDRLNKFDFKTYLSNIKAYDKLLNSLHLTDLNKDKTLKINLDYISEVCNTYSSSDIILKNEKELENLLKQIDRSFINEDLKSNRLFSDFIKNRTKYLLDIETYLSLIKPNKEEINTINRLVNILVNSDFNKISYLEDFTINTKKCNTKSMILKLKLLIESFAIINNNFEKIKEKGFEFTIDDIPDLKGKILLLNTILQKVEKNREVISKIQNNTDFMFFSDYTGVDLFDVNTLSKYATLHKQDFEKLRKVEAELNFQKNDLKSLIADIGKFDLDSLKKLLSLDELTNEESFNLLKSELSDINSQIEKENIYLEVSKYLKSKLPNTFKTLSDINHNFITKENFEFAQANNLLNKEELIDLQNLKEELNDINKKIYNTKCEILFDLAKNNFKGRFDESQINEFINLLENYKLNLKESNRATKYRIKYQKLVRKNSKDISEKLSCWVMKFNDVLNSVGEKPEIFDCIIVDEASQLDFNSVILSYYSKNMIIVGDDKQTSPSLLTGVSNDEFDAIKEQYLDFLGENIIHIRSDISLFALSKMVAGTSNLSLVEHFRCVPELIEFSKYNFYNNSLRPLKQINSDRLPPKISCFVKNAFIENKVVQEEIKEIKKFLEEILNKPEYLEKTIGVVSLGTTKHTESLKDIKEDLVNIFGGEKIDKHKLIIEDSSKFQGDERDVMIVSLGVAEDLQKLKENQNSKPRAIINNPDDFKKINVALSRAKEQMILFHSVKSEKLRSNDFRKKIIDFFNEKIKTIEPLQLKDDNTERNQYNMPEPFESWFEYDIAKELIMKGYDCIQPQFKVKENDTFYNHKTNKEVYVNFRIDLVVHNNGKIVAIECDGDPFHSLPEDVAYDIERQEFLERVGWKIYRILYSSYKKNRNEEINKMIDFIDRNTQADESIELNILSTTSEADTVEVLQNNIVKEEINFAENNLYTNNDDSKILRYFNLYEDGHYLFQENFNTDCLFSIPIEEKHKDGFLLQCYNNGHVNKVSINNLIEKEMDYPYLNGKNPNFNAKLIYLKVVNENEIIGIKTRFKNDIIFKAHKIKNIRNGNELCSIGEKVVVGFNNIEYNVLPIEILTEIDKLTYKSFAAKGKSIHNDRYRKEWKIIKKFIPKLEE